MVTNHSSEALIEKCKECDAKVIFLDSQENKVLASLTENMKICHLAYMHNHSVSAVAHDGLGGGGMFSLAAPYDALSEVISKKTYKRFALDGCCDSHGLGLFWTPKSPKDEPVKRNQDLH